MKRVIDRTSPEFLAIVLVTLAAFTAVLFDSWRLSRPLTDSAYIPQDTPLTPEIELLQEYLRFDTSNPPGREIEAALWLAEKLEKAGVQTEIIETAPGRANVVARIEGRVKGEGLLLTHHIDVVPADAATWTEPPFAANIRLGQLYGRGALDMKSIGICHLAAFIDLARSGITLERDVVFLAVADEETGGALGMAWLVQNRPDIFEGIRYGLNEGGIAETLRGEVTFFGVEVGTKQRVTLEVRSSDRRSLERARMALLPLESPVDPTRVLPEIRPTLAAVADHRVSNRDQLLDIEETIRKGDFWKLHPSHRFLVQNNAWLGGIRERQDGLYFKVDLWNLPDEDPWAEVERVRGIISAFDVVLHAVSVEGPSPISSWETPFFRDIETAVKRTYGDVGIGPQIMPLVSNDSRFLRPLGIQVYGLWPFPVHLYQTLGIHGSDENVRLDWFMDGVGLTGWLVAHYATGGREMSPEGAK